MAEHQKDLEGKPAAKKRISWKKVFIALGIIAAIIGGYFLINLITGKAVDAADASSLKIEYTIKLENGTIIAQNTSSFKPGVIGASFGLISDKLDKAIESLKKGQSATITLSPEEAFGIYNESDVSAINRTDKIERVYVQNRTFEVPFDEAKQAFNATPETGKSYEVEGQRNTLNYTVLEINNETVKVSQDAEVGGFMPFNDIIYGNITKVTDDEITFLLGAEEQTINVSEGVNAAVTLDDDYIYFTTTPTKGGMMIIGGFFQAKVIDYNETSIIIDSNGPLAGEKIIVEVKLVDVVPKKSASASSSSSSTVKKIEGAPNVELFVMAYCPYGTQIEKGILPAVKLLKDKINFEVKFVYYAMHGEKELDEQTAQYCIQKEQNAKFIPYLECFLEAGDSASCLTEAEIDKTKLDSCISATDEEFSITENFNDESTWISGNFPPFNIYAEENKAYKVQGSPTLVINGEQANAGRDPASLLKAICAAFTTAPSECNEQLSSASPKAGFGSGTAAASSGGCGS